MNKKLGRWIGVGIILTVIGWWLTAIIFALGTYQNFHRQNITGTINQFQRLQQITHPLNLFTAHRSATLEFVDQGVVCLNQADTIQQDINTYYHQLLDPSQGNPELSQDLKSDFNQVTACLTSLNQLCQRSTIFQRIAQASCDQLDQSQQLATDISPLVPYLLDENHTFLVILQNNQELRATGGFMGSFAKIKLNGGQVSELTINDIYEPEGQFPGVVTAPPGVKEYLSEGHGLRLTDANWHPDFPTASQEILHFFAQGKEQSIDNFVALNLSVIKRIFTITGEIPLPDYGVVVTSDNVDQIARADRDQFFPGSQQKTNFLNALFTQLKFKLLTLTPQQQLEIMKVLIESIHSKDILAYSNDEVLQTFYHTYQVDGALPNQPLLYLVESNVGINKANKDIYREVELNLNDYRSKLTINFKNNNPQTQTSDVESLHYINYQRLVIDPAFTVAKIFVAGQAVESWDETEITTSTGQKLTQVGFLATVPEQQTSQVVIELATQTPVTNLTVIKQPGLPSTPYTVDTPDRHQTFLLEQDTSFQFK